MELHEPLTQINAFQAFRGEVGHPPYEKNIIFSYHIPRCPLPLALRLDDRQRFGNNRRTLC